MMNIKQLLLILTIYTISTSVFAQPGANDPTFNTIDDGTCTGYIGFNDYIENSTTQPDGKIIVGGNFTSFNNKTINRLARLNTDGSLDSNFIIGSGFNGPIYSINLQADEKILVGGDFTSFNGKTTNRLVRLNTDGSLDSTFNTGIGFNGTVYSTSIQADGKILIGGSFTSYNSKTMNRFVRLDTDGSIDSTFNTGTGFNGITYSANIQADNKILVGGYFSTYAGKSINLLVRLNSDGSIDTTFDTGTGLNNTVFSITLQADEKILVGGRFTTTNGISTNGIVRLNSNGSIDTTFNTGIGFDVLSGSYTYVETIVLQTDGRILVGGGFSSFNGSTANRIIRLNTDGSTDTTFNTGTGFGSFVETIAAQPDGKIIVGGYFTTYNGAIRNRFLRLNIDGSLNDFGCYYTGFNSQIGSISIQGDGKIIVGGLFNHFNSIISNDVVRLNEDGSYDPSFNPGTSSNGNVYCTMIQPNGKILVGGSFSLFNNVVEYDLVRLNANGSVDLSFFFKDANGYSDVSCINLQKDGKILVGNGFYWGIYQKYGIKRLYSYGSTDPTFKNELFNGKILSIIVQTDGKIIIGGKFSRGIARLNSDGSLDSTFNVGTGFNSTVYPTIEDLKLQQDGKILVGGWFTSYNGTPIKYIARLNTDGSLDKTFKPSPTIDSEVLTIAIQKNSNSAYDKIVVAGVDYNNTPPISQKFIIRLNLDGSLDTTFIFIPDTEIKDNGINCSAVQKDGKLIIGGFFSQYNETHRNNIARILNCNTSATVNACEKFYINGAFQTVSGIYTDTLSNNVGCDSIITVHLKINKGSLKEKSITTCDSLFVGGAWQTTNGIYFDTLQSSNGCDSIIKTTLTLNHSSVYTIVDSMLSEPITVNGTVYDTPGIFYETLPNSKGCDSLIVINIDFNQGIKDYNTNLKIYPNPNDGLFTIESTKLGVSYSITDVRGVEVKNGIIHSKKTHINLKAIEKGIYILKSEGRTTKIVVQ